MNLWKIVLYNVVMKQMGAGHFAPEPKRPMQERPKFFLKRPNYVSRVPQYISRAPQMLVLSWLNFIRTRECSKIRLSEWSNGKS